MRSNFGICRVLPFAGKTRTGAVGLPRRKPAVKQAAGMLSLALALPVMASAAEMMAIPAPASAAAAAPAVAARADLLVPGETMRPGDRRVSPNGIFTLAFQSDGNLVLLAPNSFPVWASGTAGTTTATRGAFVAFQSDGNFVIYNSANKPLWSSGAGAGAYVAIQNDGNIVRYDGAGRPTWINGVPKNILTPGQSLPKGFDIRSFNQRHRLAMQPDGNLVLYGPSGPTWASGTSGRTSTAARFQTDGNLVLVNGDKATWTLRSDSCGAQVAVLQDDGNLVLYGASGKVIWAALPHLGRDWACTTDAQGLEAAFVEVALTAGAGCAVSQIGFDPTDPADWIDAAVAGEPPSAMSIFIGTAGKIINTALGSEPCGYAKQSMQAAWAIHNANASSSLGVQFHMDAAWKNIGGGRYQCVLTPYVGGPFDQFASAKAGVIASTWRIAGQDLVGSKSGCLNLAIHPKNLI